MTKHAFAAGLAAALAAGQSAAVTILEYQTAASTANPTLAPSAVAPGVTGDPFAAGFGLTANTGGTYNWSGWNTASTTAAAAVDAGDLWTWGFTAAPGVLFDLTSFDIRLDRSGTGPDDFVIDLSVNGGAFQEVLSFDYNDDTTGADFLGVDLSAFDAVSTAVFRLAAFNSESAAGTFDLETVDFGGSDPRSFRLEGAEVSHVPLPAALPLLLAGLAGLGFVSRRRG